MNILILEPHGDDALLSCHSILRTDNDIDILTFSSRDSKQLLKYYPSINATIYTDSRNLWFVDGKSLLNTHKVHRDYNDGLPISQMYTELLESTFGSEYVEDYKEVQSEILWQLNSNNYDIVVCPISTVHPYHVIVREAWRGLNLDVPCIYYADKYYIQNRYAKEMYEDLLKNLGLDCEINPGYTKLSEPNTTISKQLCEAYPSEAKLLRFYSDIILNYPCKYGYNSRYTIIKELESQLDE